MKLTSERLLYENYLKGLNAGEQIEELHQFFLDMIEWTNANVYFLLDNILKEEI